jgi:hypothetical protein
MPIMWRVGQQEEFTKPYQKKAPLVVSCLFEGATYPIALNLVFNAYSIIHDPEEKKTWKAEHWGAEIQA